MAVVTETPKSQGRGCRGCLPKLLIPLVLMALCAGCLLVSPLLLRAAGLIPLSAEELYAGAPDPVAGAMVDEMLREAGIDGAKTYVFPTKGRNEQLAVITMDQATRFDEGGLNEGEGAIMKTISSLAKINESGTNIERTVVAFRDADGNVLFAFTADQADVESFSRGETTRADFVKTVDADLSGLLDADRLQSLTGTAEVEDLPEITEADAEFMAGAAIEWAVGQNLITINCPPPYDAPDCAPSVNAVEVARFQASQNEALGFGLGLVGARKVNQEAATALDAANVAATMARADDLAEEGLAEGDPAKFEQALGLRPDDWSLRDKQAAFLYAQGDDAAARESLDEAELLVEEQIRAGGDCLMLRQNLLRNREVAFTRAASVHPGNRTINDQLVQTQTTLAALESGQDGGLCP